MSIRSIYFENYKAFKSAEIDLDRLSILLGTNSSGKSSIIKLLLMLSQTISSSSSIGIITTGDLTDLGDVEDIFHNQDIKKNINIELRIDPVDISKYLKTIENSFDIILRKIVRERYNHFISYSENISPDMKKMASEVFRNLRSDEYSLSDKSEIAKAILRRLPVNKEHMSDDSEFLDPREYLEFGQGSINSIINFILELKKLKYITSFGYTLSYYNGDIIIRNVYLKENENVALKIDFINWNTKKRQITFSSDIIDCEKINKQKSSVKKKLNISGLKVAWIRKNQPSINYPGSSLITSRVLTSKVFSGGVSYLISGLFNSVLLPSLRDLSQSNVKHVGPLRFQPKRFFLIENSKNIQLWDTSDGEKLSSILHKNTSLKNKINDWFKRFDLEIDISQIKNIIHSIKVKDKGINLDITDVGFGVSQILPVILQPYLSSDSGIIIIEQPEVHIHPKMQSELADFFISIIKESNKRFIIETHSEAFLKRLRRRISEHEEGLESSISNEDVAIQFIEKRENKKGSAKIENMHISASGMFEWPKDFKDNDIEDSIEFMKRQG